MNHMSNRQRISTAVLACFLLSAFACSTASIDKGIKGAASVASGNQRFLEFADAALAAGQLDKAERDNYARIAREIALDNNEILNILETARVSGFLSTAGRAQAVAVVTRSKNRIAAGQAFGIKNPDTRARAATILATVSASLDALLRFIPVGK